MRKSSLYVLGIVVSMGIVVLAARLAIMQSSAGTAYPPFSSHRADAQGLKALYDVLEVVGRNATRSYVPAEDLQLNNTTLVRLGISPGALVGSAHPGPRDPAVLAASGNTVVLGLAGDCQYAVIREWQLTLQCGDEGQYLAGPGWSVLQSNNRQQAQLVERKFGSGEILVVANSRTLNNAALARDPRSALVAMLAERRPVVAFDEEHLGVADSASVGKLLRHYRLQGVMLAALLLFGVFVWKNTSSFLPRIEATTDEIFGRDTTAGLAFLLRRTVSASGVLPVAITEWAKSVRDPEREREIRRIAALHRDPVESYNAVASALHQKRTVV